MQSAIYASALALCIFNQVLTSIYATEGKNGERTIKSIMRAAMTKGLVKKVVNQEASREEQEELVQLFTSMKSLRPPKGSLEKWELVNTELIQLAKDVRDGKPNHRTLATAVNCVRCHQEHRSK